MRPTAAAHAPFESPLVWHETGPVSRAQGIEVTLVWTPVSWLWVLSPSWPPLPERPAACAGPCSSCFGFFHLERIMETKPKTTRPSSSLVLWPVNVKEVCVCVCVFYEQKGEIKRKRKKSKTPCTCCLLCHGTLRNRMSII